MSGRRRELLEKTLQTCQAEYADQWATFTSADSKAYQTISVAGIMLAAALIFLQNDALADWIGRHWWLILLFILVTLCLVGATFCCLMAARLRRLAPPIQSEAMTKIVEDLFKLPPEELNDEAAENLLCDLIRMWKSGPLMTISTANNSKAWWLFGGQLLLGSSVLLIGLLLLLAILTPRG